MSDRLTRMRQDRHLRDSAKALVEADLVHLKNSFSRKSLTDRAVDRFAEGASEVYDEAIDVATDNKGALAAIVAALFMWFARNPIMDALFGEADEQDGEFAEQDDG